MPKIKFNTDVLDIQGEPIKKEEKRNEKGVLLPIKDWENLNCREAVKNCLINSQRGEDKAAFLKKLKLTEKVLKSEGAIQVSAEEIVMIEDSAMEAAFYHNQVVAFILSLVR